MYLDLEWMKQPMVYTKHQTRTANPPKPPKMWTRVLLSGLSYLDSLIWIFSYLDHPSRSVSTQFLPNSAEANEVKMRLTVLKRDRTANLYGVVIVLEVVPKSKQDWVQSCLCPTSKNHRLRWSHHEILFFRDKLIIGLYFTICVTPLALPDEDETNVDI